MPGARFPRRRPVAPGHRRVAVALARTLAGSCLLLGLAPAAPAAGAPAVAAAPQPVPAARAAQTDVGTAAARSAAAATAARMAAQRVRTLTATYRARSEQAATAAARLAEAFTAGSDAEQASVDAQRRLDAAGSDRAASARALYVEGQAGLVLTVLDAGSVDEALWRLSTAQRVTDDVLRRVSRRVEVAGADVGAALVAVEASRAADARLAAGLTQLRDRAAAAETALAEARAELASLSKAARRLEAAERAARELAAAEAAAEAARLAASGPVGALDIPLAYEDAYRAAAATCPGLRWTLLAGVGQVETGHGRNNGPSSAGAIGPMQFMPRTFAHYGVDGDGDGRKDAWNFRDAIPSAAHYLCSSGASGGTPEGVHRALLAYNHAEWYVDLVLGAERSIAAKAGVPAAS